MDYLDAYSLGKRPKIDDYGEKVGSLHLKQIWGMSRQRARELRETEERLAEDLTSKEVDARRTIFKNQEFEDKERRNPDKPFNLKESKEGYGRTIELEDPFVDEEEEEDIYA